MPSLFAHHKVMKLPPVASVLSCSVLLPCLPPAVPTGLWDLRIFIPKHTVFLVFQGTCVVWKQEVQFALTSAGGKQKQCSVQ